MADQANEEGKAKALTYYKILAVSLGVLGVGMLALGIVATINVDEEVFGPPYFIGGYTVGVMGLFSALICTCVVMKAADTSSDVKKQELGCAMQGHYMLSMFMLMGCFVGVFMAGIGGFAFSEEMSPLNKTLAIVILIGCIVGLLITIASMCTVCTYGKYFGVVITQGRRGRMVIINTNNSTVPMGGVHTTSTMFQSGQVNNAQVNQLQMQNQLLQQQLELQRQLNQQQQYGGGFSQQASAPPMYSADPVYPPPPPSYNDLK